MLKSLIWPILLFLAFQIEIVESFSRPKESGSFFTPQNDVYCAPGQRCQHDLDFYGVKRQKETWIDNALIIYDFEHRIPRLAIEKLDCSTMKQVVPARTKNFCVDKGLCEAFKTSGKDYADTDGIDRGHLAPAGDFKYNEDSYSKTFYYSNVFPQDSNLNRGAWYLSERLARDLVDVQGVEELYVYSGNGFLTKSGKYNSKYKYIPVIGVKNISMPDFVYKIFFTIAKGEKFVFAFLLNNKPVSYESSKVLIDHETDIETIEYLTGFEFPKILKDPKTKKLCDKYDCHTLKGPAWLAQHDEYESSNKKSVCNP